MPRIDLDDHRGWPSALARWYDAQDEDRKDVWRNSPMFDGYSREQTLLQLDKIKANDEQAAGMAGNAAADDQLTEGERLMQVMQDSQEAGDRIIAEQNASNAKRDADIIRAALDARIQND
jgi:hypothetical protein